MSENEECGQFHQRREPNCGPHVVAKDKEGRTEGPKLGERETVHSRSHSVLPDAVVQVLPLRGISLEISCTIIGEQGLIRRTQIGRATEEPGYIPRMTVP